MFGPLTCLCCGVRFWRAVNVAIFIRWEQLHVTTGMCHGCAATRTFRGEAMVADREGWL